MATSTPSDIVRTPTPTWFRGIQIHRSLPFYPCWSCYFNCFCKSSAPPLPVPLVWLVKFPVPPMAPPKPLV